MSRTINTEEEWDTLPVGTLARVGYIEHDDDGNETEGGIMTIVRVDGDVTVTVGDYMLAGGRYWSEVWVWEQGVTAADTATILPEPMYGPTDLSPDPIQAALQVIESAAVERAQPAAVLGKLQELGWAPPPVYPEGVQVWTISGAPRHTCPCPTDRRTNSSAPTSGWTSPR